jgi:ribosomal protein S18 acetylase RimI-like enzyme/catechol 2,3-dioxygenase-like lactoylglutathione lyase family enzyme
MYIDHIALWTNKLEELKNFYVKFFDCKVSELYTNHKKHFSSYFLSFADGARLEIMHKTDLSQKISQENIGLTHFSIAVGTTEKVDQLTISFEKAEIKIESYPRLTGDGYYESVILDPDGNKVELTAITDYTISKAKEEDLEQILYLQKCCYLLEAEIYNDYTIPPLKQTLDEIKNDFNNQVILKLENKGNIIGSVRAYQENNTCYIGRLIVDKNYQNKGLGKLLLNAIEKEFVATPRYELFTGAKSIKNLHLYHKMGYREFKEMNMGNIEIVYLEKINSFQGL